MGGGREISGGTKNTMFHPTEQRANKFIYRQEPWKKHLIAESAPSASQKPQ